MQTSRRQFCKSIAAVSLMAATSKLMSAAFAATDSTNTQTKENTMKPALKEESMFTLPALPYAQNALEPHISANTLSFHYGKHHQAYVTNLNNLVKDTPLASASLEDVIAASAKDPAKAGIFNNAAQVWNHTFYWNSMKPNGGGAPKGELAKKIDKDFGGLDKFKEAFKQAGATQFGSGWAWLVLDGGTLKVTKTGNADLPMVHGQKAILTMDVWEHAYYLDYQNRRPDYISTFLDKLVNWDFAEKNFA
jgi:Fe-Mn family superoxide dismutase